MKHYNTAIIVAVAITFSVLVPRLSFATPSTPDDLDVTPSETAIKITWSANTDDIEGYYIYWGKSEDSLDIPIAISNPKQTVYNLIGLNPNTTYYVAISAFDASSESTWSETVSETTLKEKTDPSAPSGFNVSSLEKITDSTVPLRWDKNKEADLAGYIIYIGTSSNDYFDETSFSEIDINANITDLGSAARYYFAISAVDISDNKSEKSDEIIVDTLIDILAPNIPANIIVKITGKNELTVSFDGNNKGMADIKGYKIYLGISPGEYKTIVDLKNNNSYTFSDLSEGTTYYFSVTSYDYSNNESEKSDEVLMKVEKIDLFSNDSKGGCFIATVAFGNYDHPAVKIFRKFRDIYLLTNNPGKKLTNFYYKLSPDIAKKIEQHSLARIVIITLLFPLLVICFLFVKIGFFSTLLLFSLPFFYSLRKLKIIGLTTVVVLLICTNMYAQENRDNLLSAKIGCFVPSDKAARDIYSASWLSVALSYERFLSENFSIDIGVGYLNKDGTLITESGEATKTKTRLILVPFSSTLKWNIEITPSIIAFMGGGLDYWYYRESSEFKKIDARDDQCGVGGYHGTAGVKLITADERYKNLGVIIETVYSKIDRFGKNNIEFGGWTFNVGLFYMF